MLLVLLLLATATAGASTVTTVTTDPHRTDRSAGTRQAGQALTEPGVLGQVTGRPAAAAYSLADTEVADGRTVTLRWNPCQIISYRINVAALPRAQRQEVAAEIRSAVARLSAATGVVYGYRGLTDVVPRSTSIEDQPAELVIAVTTDEQTDFLEPGMLGYGGYRFWEWSTVTPGSTVASAAIARGWVVVDAAGLADLRPGFGAGMSRGNVFLHELAHTVGLQHVDDGSELLNPTLLRSSPDGFSAGDLAGLARVGRTGGCIAVPSGVVADLP